MSNKFLQNYYDKFGFENITEDELNSELKRYTDSGADKKTISFITKFLLSHGLDKPWDFENTKYVNNYTKIEFTCKEHGVKSNLPFKMLLNNRGCVQCSNDRKRVIESNFIKTDNPTTLNRCDSIALRYSKVELQKILKEFGYTNISKVELTSQVSNYRDMGKDVLTLYLITKKLLRFGASDTLDYDKTEYKNVKTDITITCKEHGDFTQKPKSHIHMNNGCPECYKESRRITYEDFVIESNIAHNNRYTYDDEYNMPAYVDGGIRTKLRIKCKVHGNFFQSILHHLHRKQGCPVCCESHMEKTLHRVLIERGLVYEKDFFREKDFTGLLGLNGGVLKFDFWFPSRNLLIELDGEQHYIYKPGLHKTHQEYLNNQINDKRKDKFAVDDGIQLIRVRECDFVEWIRKNPLG